MNDIEVETIGGDRVISVSYNDLFNDGFEKEADWTDVVDKWINKLDDKNTKKPHEMSKNEYIFNRSNTLAQKFFDKLPVLDKEKNQKDFINYLEKSHKNYVDKALKSGKNVPKEVLNEYPDVVKNFNEEKQIKSDKEKAVKDALSMGKYDFDKKYKINENNKNYQKDILLEEISSGNKVYAGVLDDYPELAKDYKKVVEKEVLKNGNIDMVGELKKYYPDLYKANKQKIDDIEDLAYIRTPLWDDTTPLKDDYSKDKKDKIEKPIKKNEPVSMGVDESGRPVGNKGGYAIPKQPKVDTHQWIRGKQGGEYYISPQTGKPVYREKQGSYILEDLF